jgi:hypothetical protein
VPPKLGKKAEARMTFFIDFEGLGDTNSNDAFMFGLLVRERKIKASQYISFVAESPGKIRVAWRDFIERLESFS